MKENSVFSELSLLVTEKRNPNSEKIDELDTTGILEIINSEDHLVAPAVKKEIPHIADAVDAITRSFKQGGRLIYAGAGTSGRLGVLDASECPPTFGVSSDMVKGLIAGGYQALHQAVEGFEDHKENGAKDVEAVGVSEKDVLCGIAASKRTPYVIGAIEEAKRRKATTVVVVCNPREQVNYDVDIAICPVPGPEVIMGSTRMKAGTTQKLVLNMLTTASMIKLGKVYQNMMIDLQQNNAKLVERSKKIIMMTCDCDYQKATHLLSQAKGHVKTALFLGLTDATIDEAKRFIDENDGFLKKALKEYNKNH